MAWDGFVRHGAAWNLARAWLGHSVNGLAWLGRISCLFRARNLYLTRLYVPNIPVLLPVM